MTTQPEAIRQGTLNSAAAELRRLHAENEMLRAALEQPGARECTDPMCSCRGGPCAECPEAVQEKEIDDLRSSLDFYKRRIEELQKAQMQMRDPERTVVCDIIANGHLLKPDGGRYTAPQPAQQPTPRYEPTDEGIGND